MSNLKQISLGIMQYTQDYDERYPRWGNESITSSDDSMPWHQFEVILTGSTKVHVLTWMDFIYPYVKSSQLFVCPSARANAQDAPSYGYSSRISGYGSWWRHEGTGYSNYLFWNGQGFVKGKTRSRYVISSPLFKTTRKPRHFFKNVEWNNVDLVSSSPSRKEPPIQPTRNYAKKGSKPGYFVAVFAYIDLPSGAEAMAKELQKRGISCSVLRIY